MEAEVREILRNTLTQPVAADRLGRRIQQRFATIGGAELDLPARNGHPRPAALS